MAVRGLGISQKNLLARMVSSGPQKCTRGKSERRTVLESLVRRGLLAVDHSGEELDVFTLTASGREIGQAWLMGARAR
jgi:hypothetical protein